MANSGQLRVVVAQATLSARRVELTDLIAGLGTVGEVLISVSEPFWHIKPAVIVLVQLYFDVLQVRR
jgi:hypothetical protein